MNFVVPRISLKMIVSESGEDYPILSGPQQVAKIFSFLKEEDRENFYVAFLDTKNRIIGTHLVSVGSLTVSIVHPREVFKAAVIINANSVILCHNHPSGDVYPSSEDQEITQRLEAAGNILGIKVLDHIIIGRNGFYSLKEQIPLRYKE